MQQWREEWVKEKINIIRDRLIQEDHYSQFYPELTILSCSIISAFAADLWPGTGNDHARFVELLIRYAAHSTNPKTVSIPLLIDHLTKSGFREESSIIRSKFLDIDSSLVIHGDDYDKTENEVLEVISVPRKIIRECSYANILYKEFRSSYVHEYTSGKYATSWKMTDIDAHVSYGNWVSYPQRRIHFHFNWFVDILNSLGQNIDNLASVPLEAPKTWWIKQQ